MKSLKICGYSSSKDEALLLALCQSLDAGSRSSNNRLNCMAEKYKQKELPGAQLP